MSGHTATPCCDAKAYVERAIASYEGDPADNQFQKGFLAALVVVRDEAFTTCNSHADLVKALEEIDTLAVCTGVVSHARHYNMLCNIARIVRAALAKVS